MRIALILIFFITISFSNSIFAQVDTIPQTDSVIVVNLKRYNLLLDSLNKKIKAAENYYKILSHNKKTIIRRNYQNYYYDESDEYSKYFRLQLSLLQATTGKIITLSPPLISQIKPDSFKIAAYHLLTNSDNKIDLSFDVNRYESVRETFGHSDNYIQFSKIYTGEEHRYWFVLKKSWVEKVVYIIKYSALGEQTSFQIFATVIEAPHKDNLNWRTKQIPLKKFEEDEIIGLLKNSDHLAKLLKSK